MEDFIDCSATTHGVIFAGYVAQITKRKVDMLLDIVFSVSGCRPRATRLGANLTVLPRCLGFVHFTSAPPCRLVLDLSKCSDFCQRSLKVTRRFRRITQEDRQAPPPHLQARALAN